MRLLLPRLAVPLLALAACQAPPPAPEGLDASARYMIRNFYEGDAVFGAGVAGYLDWFEHGGGKELLGVAPTLEDVETSFTVSPLQPDDVAALPIDPDIVVDAGGPGAEDDVVGPRDLARAVGVVAVDEIPCAWHEVEAMVLGPEPARWFRAYEAYERTYLSPTEPYFEAARTGAFVDIPDAFDPHDPGFDAGRWAPSLLLTDNLADPAPQPLVGDLPAFGLRIEVRHGVYAIDGAPLGLAAALSYAPSAMWEEGGGDGIKQSFAMELFGELGAGSTLRMLAVWSEPEILGIDPSTPIALVTAVAQARSSADDLRAACEDLKATR